LDIKSWFKSSIKRYFEIDDPIEIKKNKTVRLCETYDLHNFCRSSYTGNHEYSLFTVYGNRIHRFDYCGLGPSKKWSRYSESNNGVHKWKSHANGRTQFFIDEVRNHYHNDIDSDVYSPLVSLGNNEPSYSFPVWRRRLGRPNRIDDSFLNNFAINHLSADSPQLLSEIREYQQRYNQYIKKIDSLPLIIDSIVKSKFIERGVYPTATNNYHSIGYYHFGDVAVLLEQVWDNYLHYIEDLETYRSKNNIVTRSYSENNNILFLDTLVIGNGDRNMKDRMREVLNGLPQAQKILTALRDLRDSRRDLDSRVNSIQTLAITFHTQIRRNRYQTLCPCCPTQDPAIWNSTYYYGRRRA